MSDARPRSRRPARPSAEARWAALHEFERRYPELDRDAVEYQVVSEGERGTLGVGYEPVRVAAVLTMIPESSAAPVARPQSAAIDPQVTVTGPDPATPASERLAEMLGQVVSAITVDANVRIVARGSELEATITGEDLGLIIGRHGQTIDAIQYLANAMMHRHGEHVEVVIDAQGYRERRDRMLHDVAVNAAVEVRSSGRSGRARADDLGRAQDRPSAAQGVRGRGTESEGAEPNRHVVVVPAPEGASDSEV